MGRDSRACNLKQQNSSEAAIDVIVERSLSLVEFFNCQLLILHQYLRSESAIWMYCFVIQSWH